MGLEVIAGLICPNTTSHVEHVVNTVTGEAECTGCGTVHVLEPADLEPLLVEA